MSSIRLKTGQAVELVSLEGDKATLGSPVSSPPGSTLACAIAEGDGGGEFQLKVSRCRKVDQAFHIDGRIRNATREVRAALEARRVGVRS